MQRSIDTARAIHAATTADPLGIEWAEALARDPSEVDDLHLTLAAARSAARNGGGGPRG